MRKGAKTTNKLQRENEELRQRLEEAEETIRAIHGGHVDAFVVAAAEGTQVFTIETADRPYRLLVETMQQGAVTLSADGTIVYCNAALAEMLQRPLETVIGVNFRSFVAADACFFFDRLLPDSFPAGSHGELALQGNGRLIPVFLTLSPLGEDAGGAVCLIVTDLTEQRRHEEIATAEERYRSLVTATAAIVWTTDPAGRFVMDQRSWEAFTGQSRQEYADFGWLNAIHPDDRLRVEDLWLQARETHSVYESEGRLWNSSSQTYRYFVARAAPVFNSDGTVREWIGTCIDVTERKLAEEAAREAGARLQFMAETMPQKIFTTGPDGAVDYFNRQWIEFTGLSFEQIVGVRWQQFIHPADLEENLRRWQDSIDTGAPFLFEHRFRRADGEYRWHLSRAHAMRNPQGAIVMWIGSSTEIHDLKEAEEKLKEADRRKDQFLAILAHELRNPLAPIRNAVEVLRQKSSSPREVQWSRDIIDRQVQQLTRLVDDLLDVSRVTSNKIELRRGRVPLATIIQSAVEISNPIIEALHHELTVQLPPQAVWVDVDLTRMAQALSNLLNNAAKYTPEGGRIWLTAEQQNQDALVIVRDNGIGLSADMQGKVFDMFMQAESSLHRSHGGLGIGLTLAKSIVEMHGGSLSVTSDGLGRGTELTIRLAVVEETRMDPPVASGDILSSGLPVRRILVVDDNDDIVESFALLLQMMGQEVEVAHDGEEAVETAVQYRPDLIFLDIGLPKMNGYQVAEKIRQQTWAKPPVLVAVTGWGQDEDKRRAMQAGFDAHIVKPVDTDALQEIIESCMKDPHT